MRDSLQVAVSVIVLAAVSVGSCSNHGPGAAPAGTRTDCEKSPTTGTTKPVPLAEHTCLLREQIETRRIPAMDAWLDVILAMLDPDEPESARALSAMGESLLTAAGQGKIRRWTLKKSLKELDPVFKCASSADAQGIEFLISILASDADARIWNNTVCGLRDLTGQVLEGDYERWRAWWRSAKSNWGQKRSER